MKNILYFILQFFSIIQPFDIGKIENSTISKEINRDMIIINKTNEIEHSTESLVSGATREPSRNSSTDRKEMVTHNDCRECPNNRNHPFSITNSAKPVAEIGFKLLSLLFNIA